MDVILHIGAHRTATTAFQHHLATHRDTLTEHGAVYWGPKITRAGLFRGAIGGIEGALAWQQRRFNGRCKMRAEAVRQSGANHLIVSDENMMGSLRAALEDTHFYRDAGRRVSAYAKGFEQHRLSVALCVRSYAEWWSSAMAFRLSKGGPLPRTDLREHMVTQPRRWRHIVEELARVLPDATLTVWSYEAMAHEPDRILRELTGLDTPIDMGLRRNTRPSATDLRRFLADCDVDPDEFEWSGDSFMPFAAHEREALDAQYAEDLDWLANGANGFADFINLPREDAVQNAPAKRVITDAPAKRASNGQGRGSTHDGDTRKLA